MIGVLLAMDSEERETDDFIHGNKLSASIKGRENWLAEKVLASQGDSAP